MDRNQAKQLLVDKVIGLQGIKAVQLAVEEEIITKLQDYAVPELMEELVAEGRVIEIEYVLPEMTYRVKSFYLPPGTVFIKKENYDGKTCVHTEPVLR